MMGLMYLLFGFLIVCELNRKFILFYKKYSHYLLIASAILGLPLIVRGVYAIFFSMVNHNPYQLSIVSESC
jgi:hypothetical protein